MVIGRLRRETRPAHDRLERRLDLMAPDLSISAYRTLLGRFHGFWRSWEPAAATVLDDAAFFEGRRRLHLLERDLRALGWADRLPDGLPACPSPTFLSGEVSVLGSMYVLEGSTLGGRIVLLHLQRTLGIDAGNGGAYFAGYGADTGAMWRAFCGRLEQICSDAAGNGTGTTAAGAEDIAIRAAHLTFEMLEQWLCPPADRRPASLRGEATGRQRKRDTD